MKKKFKPVKALSATRSQCIASGRTKAEKKHIAKVIDASFKKKPRCSNCDEVITEDVNRQNKGYCQECTYEAVGEGPITW